MGNISGQEVLFIARLWIRQALTFVLQDVLMEFIINLATSNGGFVDKYLDMLVRNLLPPSCGLPLFMDSLTRRLILDLVPTIALRLQRIILRRMPHKSIHKDWNALLIEIDVEIRWEHILHEDLSKVYVFDMEMDDDEENEEDLGSEAKVQLPISFVAMQSLGEVVDKMDERRSRR
eukprot:Gb_12535 [translate_table: standard]